MANRCDINLDTSSRWYRFLIFVASRQCTLCADDNAMSLLCMMTSFVKLRFRLNRDIAFRGRNDIKIDCI